MDKLVKVKAGGREFEVRDMRSAPPDPLPAKYIIHYAVFSKRGYYGTVKYHKRLECPVLLSWKPDLVLFDGTIWRDYAEEKYILEETRCKRCWK